MLGRRGSESLSPDVVTKDITLPGQKVLVFWFVLLFVSLFFFFVFLQWMIELSLQSYLLSWQYLLTGVKTFCHISFSGLILSCYHGETKSQRIFPSFSWKRWQWHFVKVRVFIVNFWNYFINYLLFYKEKIEAYYWSKLKCYNDLIL